MKRVPRAMRLCSLHGCRSGGGGPGSVAWQQVVHAQQQVILFERHSVGRVPLDRPLDESA